MTKAVSNDTRRRIARHIERLADPDLNVSARAELRLIRFGAKALPELLAAAKSSKPIVRFRAAWALGKTRDPRAFETISKLTSDIDPCVRYDAALALGELGDHRAIPLLKALASQPPDEASINSAAKQALTRLKAAKRK